MRVFYICLAAGILFGCLCGCKTRDSKGSTLPEPEQKPNIIYVLADRWRAQATGYGGDPNLIGKTPQLDAFANRGINFRNAILLCPGNIILISGDTDWGKAAIYPITLRRIFPPRIPWMLCFRDPN